MYETSPGALQTPTPRVARSEGSITLPDCIKSYVIVSGNRQSPDKTEQKHRVCTMTMGLCTLQATASPLDPGSQALGSAAKKTGTPTNTRTRKPMDPSQVSEMQSAVKVALDEAGKKSKTNRLKQAAEIQKRPEGEQVPKAKSAVQRALELQASDAEAKKKAGKDRLLSMIVALQTRHSTTMVKTNK